MNTNTCEPLSNAFPNSVSSPLLGFIRPSPTPLINSKHPSSSPQEGLIHLSHADTQRWGACGGSTVRTWRHVDSSSSSAWQFCQHVIMLQAASSEYELFDWYLLESFGNKLKENWGSLFGQYNGISVYRRLWWRGRVCAVYSWTKQQALQGMKDILLTSVLTNTSKWLV